VTADFVVCVCVCVLVDQTGAAAASGFTCGATTTAAAAPTSSALTAAFGASTGGFGASVGSFGASTGVSFGAQASTPGGALPAPAFGTSTSAGSFTGFAFGSGSSVAGAHSPPAFGAPFGAATGGAFGGASAKTQKSPAAADSTTAASASKPGHGAHSSSGNEVSQLHAKFFQDPRLFQDPSRSFCAKLGSDDDFAGGMQGKLGKMPLAYVKAMFLEHNRAHDAQNEFMFGNKGKTSTAQREWRYVVGSQGVDLHTWTFDLDVADPEYTPEDLLEGRNVKPLRELMQLSMVKKVHTHI